ncbi:MutS-related protein [Pedobacter antarcticus]|uniref:MutS-related protein n=1 Tax=Pedobacter antarcticus TaxID=34086 RepID=UPI002930ABDD|nr:DNA mismatch repair protein MutS [Pedobacter antarcticus]
MVNSRDSILKDYQNSINAQKAEVERLKKKLNTISLSRLGLFVAEIILVALIISIGFHPVLGVATILPVLIFLWLVKKQVTVENELSYAGQLLTIYENEDNLIRNHKSIYADGTAYENELHPYSSDLDIFGKRSLYAKVNRATTRLGKELLAQSFSVPAAEEDILLRQQAITELSGKIQETFHFRAGLQGQKENQLETIAAKLENDLPKQLQFIRGKVLRTYISIVPYLSLAGIILGYIYGDKAWSLFGVYLFINISLVLSRFKSINQLYYGFSGGSTLLNSLSGTIRWVEEVNWQSSYIQRFTIQDERGKPLSRQIKELSGIIVSFDARLNVLVGSVLNLFMLHDLKCAVRLDKWYAQSAAGMLRGLETISHFEELISLATLRYNEPEWVYPAISSAFCLEAVSLGHPLINEKHRVVNSYSFESAPTVDIVTGSNMAGKSTFLRTAGVNMVLAYAGAPVCASSFKVSIFSLLSYMRIKDSLNDQTSTFKAELNRLKMILDGVARLPNALVLIDEMLRGTNSRDKYLGSKVFIEHLIGRNTPALFATHDLQLSEMIGDHPVQVRNYHFDIQLAEGEMNFDYLLKTGACKTFNAAILLKEIGLELPASMDL